MALNIGFLRIAENVGMPFEHIVLLLVVAGSLIFFAKDFKIGMVMLFISSGLCFMWFYAAGLNYVFALVTFLMSLIILSLSLYAVAKSHKAGAII